MPNDCDSVAALSLSAAEADTAFPWHIALDANLHVTSLGSSLAPRFAGVRHNTDLFSIVRVMHPAAAVHTFESLANMAHSDTLLLVRDTLYLKRTSAADRPTERTRRRSRPSFSFSHPPTTAASSSNEGATDTTTDVLDLTAAMVTGATAGTSSSTATKSLPPRTEDHHTPLVSLSRPASPTLNWHSAADAVNRLRSTSVASTPYIARSSDHLYLRGEFAVREGGQGLVFLGTPFFNTLEHMTSLGVGLEDLPIHSNARELLHGHLHQSVAVSMAQELLDTRSELDQAVAALRLEQRKQEALLHSILPKDIARQLAQGVRPPTRKHANVSMLFSDIVDFTTISSSSSPCEIMVMLDKLFSRFDALCANHNVYKLETIGDAYLVTSGLPTACETHADQLAAFAIDMMDASRSVTRPDTGEPLQIRIGLHTGTVVAGVAGTSRPRYCVFGDTVNVASRMESTSEPGRIQLSGEFRRELIDSSQFRMTRRGYIAVKGKGQMCTFFLEGLRGDGDDAGLETPVAESAPGLPLASCASAATIDFQFPVLPAHSPCASERSSGMTSHCLLSPAKANPGEPITRRMRGSSLGDDSILRRARAHSLQNAAPLTPLAIAEDSAVAVSAKESVTTATRESGSSANGDTETTGEDLCSLQNSSAGTTEADFGTEHTSSDDTATDANCDDMTQSLARAAAFLHASPLPSADDEDEHENRQQSATDQTEQQAHVNVQMSLYESSTASQQQAWPTRQHILRTPVLNPRSTVNANGKPSLQQGSLVNSSAAVASASDDAVSTSAHPTPVSQRESLDGDMTAPKLRRSSSLPHSPRKRAELTASARVVARSPSSGSISPAPRLHDSGMSESSDLSACPEEEDPAGPVVPRRRLRHSVLLEPTRGGQLRPDVQLPPLTPLGTALAESAPDIRSLFDHNLHTQQQQQLSCEAVAESELSQRPVSAPVQRSQSNTVSSTSSGWNDNYRGSETAVQGEMDFDVVIRDVPTVRANATGVGVAFTGSTALPLNLAWSAYANGASITPVQTLSTLPYTRSLTFICVDGALLVGDLLAGLPPIVKGVEEGGVATRLYANAAVTEALLPSLSLAGLHAALVRRGRRQAADVAFELWRSVDSVY